MTLTNQLIAPAEAPANAALMGLMMTIHEIYCRYECESRHATLKARVERGESLGPTHYGYRKPTARARRAGHTYPRLDAHTAPLVRWAFESFATSECSVAELEIGLAAYAASLNPKRLPKLPPYQRLRSILRDPFYMGSIRFDRTEYPGAHEPLVTPELFARVQDRLAATGNHH